MDVIHQGSEKLAVSNVYIVAQVTNNEAFKEWNHRLYCSIRRDVNILTETVYICIIIRDFNGYIGDEPWDGIHGNFQDVNHSENHLELHTG